MTNPRSERRLIENEVIFKEHNKEILAVVKQLAVKDRIDEQTLQFYCECSNEFCIETIALPPKTYESLHSSLRQFIVKPGHETDEIEKVIETSPEYSVIEKFEVPPSPSAIKSRPSYF